MLLPEVIRQPLRPVYRTARTAYLTTMRPEGGVLTCHGVPVFCDFGQPSYAWYDSNSESARFSLNLLAWLIDQADGGTYLDVGAHFGFYAAAMSRILASHSRTARVLAIEPDRRNFRCLQQTAGQPGARGLVPIFAALGDSDGTVELFDSGDSCLHSYRSDGARSLYAVPMLTLDTLLAQYAANERAAFIKLDIDGAEPAFFRAARARLKRDGTLLITELCPSLLRKAGVDPHQFFRLLCEDFVIYWAHGEQWPLRLVTDVDYERVALATGEAVTDLILSPRSLELPDELPRAF